MSRTAPSLAPIIDRLPAAGRRVTRWRLIIKALAYETDRHEAWEQGQSLLAEMEAVGHTGLFIHLGARLAALAVLAKQAPAGAALATRVMAALREHMPDDITRAHALWLCAQGLESANDPAAESARAQAKAWLEEVAATKVPAEFTESFLHRHLPHRQVLAAAAGRVAPI